MFAVSASFLPTDHLWFKETLWPTVVGAGQKVENAAAIYGTLPNLSIM
jgi:hypothetical protein